jgi:hypothetical protein
MRPPILFGQTQILIAKIVKLVRGRLNIDWNESNGSVCQNGVISDQPLKTLLPQHSSVLPAPSALTRPAVSTALGYDERPFILAAHSSLG